MEILKFDDDEISRALSTEGREGQVRAAVQLVGQGVLNEAFVETPDGDVAHIVRRSTAPKTNIREIKRS